MLVGGKRGRKGLPRWRFGLVWGGGGFSGDEPDVGGSEAEFSIAANDAGFETDAAQFSR